MIQHVYYTVIMADDFYFNHKHAINTISKDLKAALYLFLIFNVTKID